MLIKVDHISKSFKKHQVLSNVDLEIAEGSIVSLLGPNGAGKTTLLNIISGLIKADQGKVFIQGQDHLALKNRIGYIPQEIALYQNLTVAQNMTFFAEIYGVKKQDKQQKITSVLTNVGLIDVKNKKVKHLSGGNKRRLNIGVELLKDPICLVMDEGTVGIDIYGKAQILSLMLSLNQQGLTIIFTSHDLLEIAKVATKVCYMKEGKIAEVIYPTKGLERQEIETVYKKLYEN